MSKISKSYKHRYLFKAAWRATAIKFIIEAQNEKQAIKRAEGKVFRMEGGPSCLEVTLLEKLS